MFRINKLFLKHKNQIGFISKIILLLRYFEHIFVSHLLIQQELNQLISIYLIEKIYFYYINQKNLTNSTFVSHFVN
jgi:hypothetical protein